MRKFPPIMRFLLFSRMFYAVNVNALLNFMKPLGLYSTRKLGPRAACGELQPNGGEQNMESLNTLLQCLYTLFQYLYSL